HGAGTDRGAGLAGHADRLPVGGGLGGEIRVHGAGEVVVGEDRGGAHEHAVGQRRRLVHQGVVLDLATVTHLHAGADVGTAADDASGAEHGILSHLGQVPDHGAAPDVRRFRHVGGVHDPYVCTLESIRHGADTTAPYPPSAVPALRPRPRCVAAATRAPGRN